MKIMITALTVLLVASIYILMFQEAQAQSVQIYSITCEDSEGNKLHSVRYAAGADLSELELPEAPAREGYVFIGWSAELPETMPNSSLVYVPIYMQTTLTVYQTLS
jgi:hypothetical protein